MFSVKQKIAAVLMSVGVVVGITACEDGNKGEPKESANVERQQVNGTYDKLVAQQPAHSMNYSPTRDTKNFWIDTWGQDPNKLSYVYLMASDGNMIGYFVLKGLPVSYCTSLVPTFDINSNVDGKVVVPRPSMDGTYSSGNNCNAFYGQDATTGAYVEYTAGMGISPLLYDQPLAQPGIKPLGKTKIEDIK